MAYDASTDYTAKKNALKKQMETETDATKKAALQAEYDAADNARIEKMASNLSKYGKWGTDSEVDSAAGLMAQNQIGTAYETQKANLNKSYDQAKQNASNAALSRGMARSSFVQDRMANLDSERASGISDIDASKALAIQNAKAKIIDNYQTNRDNALAAEKSEFAKTINAYYNDFQQEINNVSGNGDTSDDWKIPYLQAARNEKILYQQEKAEKAAKEAAKSGSGGGTSNDNNTSTGSVQSLEALKYGIAKAKKMGVSGAQVAELIDKALAAGQITDKQAEELGNAYL